MSSPKKTLRRTAFVVILILLVLYVLFQSKNLILGPVITVNEPRDGETVTYEVVDVKGTAKNIAYIYLNGRQIFVDTNGQFNEKLIAPAGYSIIQFDAQDKFGRKSKKEIRIILQKSEEIITPQAQEGLATTTNNQTQ